MTGMQAIWLLAGLALGYIHAAGIWRTAQQPTAGGAVFGVLRMVVVGLGLTAAALLGGIIPAAAGWAIGFFATALVWMLARHGGRERRTSS